MWRLRLAFILVALGLGFCVPSWLAEPSVNSAHSAEFDAEIKSAVDLYLPGYPWRLLKAQLIAESALDPAAVGPKGEVGIAQFTEDTWAQVSVRIDRAGAPRTDPSAAILGAAYYMAELRRAWPGAQGEDRDKLAAASYNAGLRNVRSASRACGGAQTWAIVQRCLEQFTGGYADITRGYVANVWRLWHELEDAT